MNLFDIIGPVMVGPSSSHTAGAVRIGNIARKLLTEEVQEAIIYFHGSFQSTGKGHGTDKALLAGLMGMPVDDSRIPYSFDVAQERGLRYEFRAIDLGDAHPNSVKFVADAKTPYFIYFLKKNSREKNKKPLEVMEDFLKELYALRIKE